jgi:hypothetical protein
MAQQAISCLHLYRVRAVAGLPSNKEGELSCSSCHATARSDRPRDPRTTCAKCHNGQPDARAGRQVIASTNLIALHVTSSTQGPEALESEFVVVRQR